MSDYNTNIGAFQKDKPGSDYYTNIGADQTDDLEGPGGIQNFIPMFLGEEF